MTPGSWRPQRRGPCWGLGPIGQGPHLGDGHFCPSPCHSLQGGSAQECCSHSPAGVPWSSPQHYLMRVTCTCEWRAPKHPWVVTQISSFQPVHIFKKQAFWGKQSVKLNAHLLLLIKPHHSTKNDNTNNDLRKNNNSNEVYIAFRMPSTILSTFQVITQSSQPYRVGNIISFIQTWHRKVN